MNTRIVIITRRQHGNLRDLSVASLGARERFLVEIVIYVAMYNVTITTLIIQATGPKREYPDRGGATGKYD